MASCSNLHNCPFVKKYCNSRAVNVLGSFLTYCKGGKERLCKRKIYKEKYGKNPSDNMLPDGALDDAEKPMTYL